MLNIIKNTINRVFASGVDSDASAFITATGLSGTTQKSAITTLVKDLKSSGLWSKMKAVYPMVTDNYNTRSYTEDFTNAFWSKYFSTITANTVVAPNGTLTGETLNEDNSTNPHSIYSDSSSLANTQYTSSIYVKAGTRRYVQLAATPNANDWAACIFDTTNPSFTKTQVSGNVTATFAFSAEANGWYRLSITWACTVSGIASPLTVALIDVPTPTLGVYAGYSYTGNSSYVYVWGAQTQLGGLTQYQPIATTPSAFMASQMKYNLKDARDLDAAFRLTWSGGWTYSSTGATPNGTNGYADTKLVPSSTLASQNSTHLSYYINQNAKIQAFQMGVRGNNASDTFIGARFSSTQNYNNVNYNLPTLNTETNNVSGMLLVSRTSSTNFKYYKNSSLYQTNVATSSALPDIYSIYLGTINLMGATLYPDNARIAFATIGDGLTDQDAQLLNQITEKYQVALSRGVQAAQSFYYNSAYSNEANTYLYSTQITGTTQVSAINTLINGLKANNLWSKMKAVYPFVTDKTLQADMAAQMKFNLVNPQDTDAAFRLAFSGGWTYSTNGAQPNGTNGYADTKLVPSGTTAQNSLHISAYLRTDITQNSVVIGGYDGVVETSIYPRFTGNIIYSAINSNTSASAGASSSSLGNFIASRLISTQENTYIGNTKLTRTQSSLNNLTRSIFIGALNYLGGANVYSSRQTSFASIGDGLTDAEAALLYQLVQQFQTDLSRQV